MSESGWLPEMFSVNPWEHDTYDKLYDVFHDFFIAGEVIFRGQSVGYDSAIVDGRANGFWHITTRKDVKTGERLPDPRRCERLPWLKPMVENSDKVEVLAWEYDDGDGVNKLYVWLKDHDYVAIMKKNKKGKLYLLSAFWVEYPSAKRKLMQKYQSSKIKY